MTSRLHLPSRKLFVQQVKNSSCVGPHKTIENLDEWLTDINGKQLQYSIVWIQGTVTQNLSDEQSLVLEDETDSIHVDRSTAVPVVGDVDPGTYLMVIGEVEATPGGPVIKAVKVQDLSADPVARFMWRQEVLDLQTHAL